MPQNTANDLTVVLVVAIIIIVIVGVNVAVKRTRSRRDVRQVGFELNSERIRSRKERLDAVAGVGLVNISGLNAEVDEICGVYLLRDKLRFEATKSFLEIPITALKSVFIEQQAGIAHLAREGKRTKFLSIFFPLLPFLQFSDTQAEYSIESTLVFEYIGESGSTDYAVFSFGADKRDDVYDFRKNCNDIRNEKKDKKDETIK